MSVEVRTVAWSGFRPERLLSLLSPDEQARAGRLTKGSARARFVIARGLLRQLVGERLGLPPTDVGFDYSSTGKPRLAATLSADHPHVSVSHGERFGVIALSRGAPLGVDVETPPADRSALRLAERFFTDAEATQLRRMPQRDRPEAFAAMWTAKEALIKAHGETVPSALPRYEVRLEDDGSIGLASIQGDPGSVHDWQLEAVRLDKRHTATVAVGDPNAEIRWLPLSGTATV